jgi:hypothetical protein
MMPDISIQVELKAGVDALYVTRLQKERQAPAVERPESGTGYPVVDRKLLREKEFEKTLVMHPLPRVDELACEVDSDPRSMYFKQAAYGVPVRMALLSFLLGAREIPIAEEEDLFVRKTSYPVYKRDSGVRCPNRNCASNQETEVKYIKPEFKIVSLDPVILRCIYCDHEVHPRYVASSDWHQGKLESKKYHSADSHWARKIRPENLIVFPSEKEARARQFKPSRSVRH